eukprot:s2670_g8.t1
MATNCAGYVLVTSDMRDVTSKICKWLDHFGLAASTCCTPVLVMFAVLLLSNIDLMVVEKTCETCEGVSCGGGEGERPAAVGDASPRVEAPASTPPPIRLPARGQDVPMDGRVVEYPDGAEVEPCIYQGKVGGETALLVAYVDDLFLCCQISKADNLVEQAIGKAVPLKQAGLILLAAEGGGSLTFTGRVICRGTEDD